MCEFLCALHVLQIGSLTAHSFRYCPFYESGDRDDNHFGAPIAQSFQSFLATLYRLLFLDYHIFYGNGILLPTIYILNGVLNSVFCDILYALLCSWLKCISVPRACQALFRLFVDTVADVEFYPKFETKSSIIRCLLTKEYVFFPFGFSCAKLKTEKKCNIRADRQRHPT